MASLYIRNDSPYYWIRYYDVHEEDPTKRPKALPTKIKVTESDRNKRILWEKAGKITKAPQIRGNNQTKDLLQRFISASVDLNIEAKTGLKVTPTIRLNQGLKEFLSSKPQLAKNTVRSYELAEWHLRQAIGDKPIHSITHSDFNKLLKRFDLLETSLTSQAIYTRSLYALFRYFYKKRYCEEVVIIVLKAPKKAVEPIPQKDMKVILDYFQENRQEWKNKRKIKEAKEQYNLIYFLLLTGVRISTALVQTWERIDLKDNMMTCINVKAKNQTFYFPIHPELRKFLLALGPRTENLFSYSYKRGTPAFWKRNIKVLFENKKIKKEYKLHDLRKTFTSWMANSGVDSGYLQLLLNHSDVRTTKSFYQKMEIKTLNNQFKNVKFKK